MGNRKSKPLDPDGKEIRRNGHTGSRKSWRFLPRGLVRSRQGKKRDKEGNEVRNDCVGYNENKLNSVECQTNSIVRTDGIKDLDITVDVSASAPLLNDTSSEESQDNAKTKLGRKRSRSLSSILEGVEVNALEDTDSSPGNSTKSLELLQNFSQAQDKAKNGSNSSSKNDISSSKNEDENETCSKTKASNVHKASEQDTDSSITLSTDETSQSESSSRTDMQTKPISRTPSFQLSDIAEDTGTACQSQCMTSPRKSASPKKSFSDSNFPKLFQSRKSDKIIIKLPNGDVYEGREILYSLNILYLLREIFFRVLRAFYCLVFCLCFFFCT